MPLANLATTPEVIAVEAKFNAGNDFLAEQSQTPKMESADRAAAAASVSQTDVEQKPPGESPTRNTAKTDTNNKTLLSTN